MRKLYLLNESGEAYYFDFSTKTLVSNISDLGFKKDLTFLDYENEKVLIKEKNSTSMIELELIFLNGYKGYTNFINYKIRSSGRLKLCYVVNKEMKYVFVAIESLSKTDLNYLSLKCSLSLNKLSMWYKDISSSIVLKEPADGKLYSYKYPYVYGSGYDGSQWFTNNGEIDAALNIMIQGAVINPKLYIIDHNEVIAELSLLVESKNCIIEVNSDVTNQYMIMKENGITTNIYQKQDFRFDNFLFLPRGTYLLRFDSGVEDYHTFCRISYKEGYSGH